MGPMPGLVVLVPALFFALATVLVVAREERSLLVDRSERA